MSAILGSSVSARFQLVSASANIPAPESAPNAPTPSPANIPRRYVRALVFAELKAVGHTRALARIFQPLQTLSAAPTGGGSSTGLGLHLAREIVALPGGRLDADSIPGDGAAFAIVLPVPSTSPASPAA